MRRVSWIAFLLALLLLTLRFGDRAASSWVSQHPADTSYPGDILDDTSVGSAKILIDQGLSQAFMDEPESYRHRLAPATLYFEALGARGIGIRYSGSSRFRIFLQSRLNMTPSYFLEVYDHSDAGDFQGTKKIYLRSLATDPSQLREKLGLDWFRRFNLLAPRGRFVDVRLNDLDPAMYLMTEKLTQGRLHKLMADDPGRLESMEEAFISGQRLQELIATLEPDYFARYLVVSALMGDSEGFFNFSNFDLYSRARGKLIIPTDLDRTFISQCAWLEALKNGSWRNGSSLALMNLVNALKSSSPAVKASVIQFIDILRSNDFEQTPLRAEIDRLYMTVGARMEAPRKKYFVDQLLAAYRCGTDLVLALRSTLETGK